MTTYPVIGLEPLLNGASQLTTAWPVLAVAVGVRAAPGVVYGTTAAEVPAAPVPMALVAVTRKVYEPPTVKAG